jgi:hypothetical protein
MIFHISENQSLTQMQFIEDCIERVPDLYLDELQTLVRDECNVAVGITTIHRTLRQRGWTRKKVCFLGLMICPIHFQRFRALLLIMMRRKDWHSSYGCYSTRLTSWSLPTSRPSSAAQQHARWPGPALIKGPEGVSTCLEQRCESPVSPKAMHVS